MAPKGPADDGKRPCGAGRFVFVRVACLGGGPEEGRWEVRAGWRPADFFLGCFSGCFSVSFSVSFFLRSWAGPRRSWSPTWPQLEPMLKPCWPLFGTFLGVLLASQLKMTFKTIFCRFLIAVRFSASSKTLPLSMILKIVACAS